MNPSVILIRSFLFLSLWLISRTALSSNPSIALGEWREHIPYGKAIRVAEGNGRIYCATEFGMFSYDKSDGSINRYSKLNGLSDYEIGGIRFDKASGILVIFYKSSNIDLLLPDQQLVNLSDIKRQNIVGGKSINDVLFIGHEAYLSCEFGIVVMDLVRQEIKDTYYIGSNGSNINVQGLAFDGTTILAATETGIYSAAFQDPNIFNFTAWTKDSTLTEPDANYTSATMFSNRFYVVKTNPAVNKDSVLVRDNGIWQPFFSNAREGAIIDSYENYLLYINLDLVAAMDASGNTVRLMQHYAYPETVKYGFLDSENTFWVADYYNGLVSQSGSGSAVKIFAPNSPKSEAVWAMASKGGYTWIASGSMTADAPNFLEQNGSYLFQDNTWKSFNRWSDSLYSSVINSTSPALVCVAVDPSDPKHAYFGSWYGGVLEYSDNGGVQVFNESNSILKSITGLTNYIIVGGMDFDSDNNLWVVAGGTTSPIYERKSDGSWQSFVIPDGDFARFGLYQVLVDDFNQKWFIAREGASTGHGLGVFNENDILNPNDNSFLQITSDPGHGGLPDMFVRAMAKDKDGSIWLGTNAGVAVIYNPGNVFTGGNYDAQQVIIEQDGYAQYLLATEIVTAVAVDGANRKWFGTYSGGAFLMSADGTKQLQNFNTDNSPLPSNSIQAITIDEVSGEIFFGTDKGIVSYRGEATEGGKTCDDYYAYPNPVKHDYHGPIAIRGLVADADVKITDISGNLVNHLKAYGGQAIWNGANFQGERVQTGVYTVFISNEDGTETCVTKVLFAN